MEIDLSDLMNVDPLITVTMPDERNLSDETYI